MSDAEQEFACLTEAKAAAERKVRAVEDEARGCGPATGPTVPPCQDLLRHS